MYLNHVQKVSLFLLIIMLTPVSQFAQDRSLEETLEMLSEDAASQYIKPISSAFGANLNGAWFHRAPASKIQGLDIELGVVAMGSFFPDDSKHFDTSGQFTFSQNEAEQIVNNNQISNPQIRQELISALTSSPSTVGISGATVIGSADDNIIVNFKGGTYETSAGDVTLDPEDVELPIAGYGDLAEVNVLPLAAPQLTVGTIFGTQATFRYLPSVTLNDELGKLNYFGFGVQHNPFIWFRNPMPFDMAVGFYTQTLDIGSLFSTKTTSFGLNASKQFGAGMLNVTPYAGFMLESATMDVTYQYIVDTPAGPLTQDIDFSLKGENKNRFILGMNFRLLLLNLNVDYNFGKYNALTAGLNFIF